MKAIICDSSGHLILRLKVLGLRFAEQTQYTDTPKNREYLYAIQKKINEDIKDGILEYKEHFPHSKNERVLSAIKSKFVSPAWRGLPTVRHFLNYEYHSILEQPQPKMMLHIMSCIGDVKVDEVTGLHIVNLAKSLKSIVGMSRQYLFIAMSFVLDLIDKAALVYIFDRPFRLINVEADQELAKPLSHKDIMHIARFIPVRYHDFFMCQYYFGLSSRDLIDLEWRFYNTANSTFDLSGRSIHVAPYSRRLLFKLMKTTGNFRHVFSDLKGQKKKLNYEWLNNDCWRKACIDSGNGRLRIGELRKASIPYLFESGLSVSQISQQTKMLYRPHIDNILSRYILL